MQELNYLDLTSCFSLAQLPESMAQLKSLQVLYLVFCGGLKTLPSSMGQLSNLQRISLPDHRQFKAAFDFSDCSKLKTLGNVRGSNFRGASASITHLGVI